MTASVRELKSKLSRYLKRAAAGEEVTVTSRGRPIARLVWVTPQGNQHPGEAEVRRLLAAIPGIILPTGPKPRGSKHPMRIRKGEKRLSEIVLGDRR
ncbi:MAG: type II toxin-antitoxin system prevent-host-death family antitoxin [Deltaproteobacteria bacterium]|nr:type II toxin-antitoxin system prevent-host-death family antitoxin [Deltaproteobacteria bacterium]